MKRITVTITEEHAAILDQLVQDGGYQSLAQALVATSAEALRIETKAPQWGGKRDKK